MIISLQKEFLPPSPVLGEAAQGVAAPSSTFDYEATVRSILADREGKKTWPQLESLEERAPTDPAARSALSRLETLNAAIEFGQTCSETKPSYGPKETALLLDRADPETKREGWKLALDGASLGSRIAILEKSKDSTGWQILGYPPCIGKEVGPSSPQALEVPARWSKLLRRVLVKGLSPENEDARLKEYRTLVQAYDRLEKGNLGERVSRYSLAMDIKALEEQILPEHVEKAKAEARAQHLGHDQVFNYHPQSRVRQFLGRLSVTPASSRERYIHSELTRVAHRGTGELSQFAAHALEEINACSQSLSSLILPQFWKALAEVARNRGEQELQCRKLGNSQNFNDLLSTLHRDISFDMNDSESLEFYRSGLTVNGMVRNYT